MYNVYMQVYTAHVYINNYVLFMLHVQCMYMLCIHTKLSKYILLLLDSLSRFEWKKL